MFPRRIGIDLGTANTLVYVLGKGIVINEPSVIAVEPDTKKILAVGNAAKAMLGRTPKAIIASRPLRDGVIADYQTTQAMLNHFISKALGVFQVLKPEVIISVPAGITSTERRAVIEAAMRVGVKAAYVVKEPILAAIGAGIAINEPSGHMVVDIGGGTSEVAVISLGAIVTSASVRVGGDKLDQAIVDYIRKRHNLDIGLATAEQIKISIGRAVINEEDDTEEVLEIRGRDMIEGLPKIIAIRSNEIPEAIADELQEILQAIKAVLQETPPELAADVMDKGIVLTGGGALLRDIDKLASQATGVPAFVAEESLLCVVKGIKPILERLDTYKHTLLSKRPLA